MNVVRLVGMLRRHWLLIVLLSAVTTGGGAWAAFSPVARYRAAVLLEVQAPADSSGAISLQGTLSARERAVTIAALAGTDVVVRRAAPVVDRLTGVSMCGAATRGQSEFIVVACTGTSAANVTVAANARAAALQAELDAQRHARITELAAAYAQQLKTLHAQGVPPSSYPGPPVYQTYREVSVIDPAQVPKSPYAPSRTRTLALAVVLGLLVNCSIALLYERLRNRAATPDELADALGTPLVGTIPRLGRKASRSVAA